MKNLATLILILAILGLSGIANANDRFYAVKKNDSLWRIAEKKLGNPWLYKKIAKDNNLENPNLIKVGQRLKIVEVAIEKPNRETKKVVASPISGSKIAEPNQNPEAVVVKMVDDSKAKVTDSNPVGEEVVLFSGMRGEESKDDASYPHREFTAGVGAWRNPSQGTKGVYAFVDHIEKPFESKDYGVGFFGLASYGKGGHGVSWWMIAPGIQASIFKDIGDNETFQVKPRLMYAIKNVHFGGEDHKEYRWMPGIYAEASKIFTPRDRGIVAVDANYFKDDSYGNVALYWERLLNGRDLKFRAGLGAVYQESMDDSWGMQPSLQLEFFERWVVGVNATIIKGGPVFGGLVYYKAQKDIQETWERMRQEQFKKVTP